MRGRFELIDGKRVFVWFPVMRRGSDLLANRDVRPTQQVLVLQADYAPELMRWGLVPAWAKDPRIGAKIINARAEGIADKPSFKRPLRSQRCLIEEDWLNPDISDVEFRQALLRPYPSDLLEALP